MSTTHCRAYGYDRNITDPEQDKTAPSMEETILGLSEDFWKLGVRLGNFKHGGFQGLSGHLPQDKD